MNMTVYKMLCEQLCILSSKWNTKNECKVFSFLKSGRFLCFRKDFMKCIKWYLSLKRDVFCWGLLNCFSLCYFTV